MTRPRTCDCGEIATSHRNLGGVLLWRCADVAGELGFL